MAKTRRAFRTPMKALALATAAAVTFAPIAPAATSPETIAGATPQAELTVGFPQEMQDKVNAGTMREPVWRARIQSAKYKDFVKEIWAYSPSMGRTIPLVVIQGGKDKNTPRPTLYLLNGGDGGEGRANWVMQTDVFNFYKDKEVNVVIPMQGAFSYYTDWQNPSIALGGKQMWETFLTKELPGPLEREIHGNNQRAIAGMSMSATSSLLLAEHNPGFYDAVGSFSGCASTSTTLWGLISTFLTMLRGDASAWQAWGPLFSTTRTYNDALENADKLRGTAIYVSNGSGFAGTEDLLGSETVDFNLASFLARVVDGGLIEGITNACTHDLKAKLNSEGIPAEFNFRKNGTHTWTYWSLDLRDSWKVFAKAWGMEVTEEDLFPPTPWGHDDGEAFRYGMKAVLGSNGGSIGSSMGSSVLSSETGLDKYLDKGVEALSGPTGSSPGSSERRREAKSFTPAPTKAPTTPAPTTAPEPAPSQPAPSQPAPSQPAPSQPAEKPETPADVDATATSKDKATTAETTDGTAADTTKPAE